EGGDVVVRDAHLGSLIGRDPLPIVARNGGTEDVLTPGLPAVLARRDRDVREAQARHVDIVDAVGVRLWCGAQVRVATSRRHSPSRPGDLVRSLEPRLVQATVGGLPGE